MALFLNPNEEEIKKRKMALDKRENELVRKEADLKDWQDKIQRQQLKLGKERERLADLNRDLVVKKVDITLREENAEAGFAEQHGEAFREVIENRLRQLDNRKEELDALQEQLAKRLEKACNREGDLASREMAVKERELKVDAGFADKGQKLLDEIEKREAACLEQEQKLREQEKELLVRHGQQEARSENLRKREDQLARAEKERDEGFSELRRELDLALHNKRQAVEEELGKMHSERVTQLDTELNELRSQRLQRLKEELKEERARTGEELAAMRTALEEEKKLTVETMKSSQNELGEERARLEAKDNELHYREKMMAAKEARLEERKASLDAEVAQLVQERKVSYDSRERMLENECVRLRESLTRAESFLGRFEELKNRLGDEPEKVLLKLNQQTEELGRLREELLQRPTQEMRKQYEIMGREKARLESRLEELLQEKSELQRRMAEENDLRVKLSEQEKQNEKLRREKDSLDCDCTQLHEKLRRIQAAYKREEDVEDRIRLIEEPHHDFTEPRPRRSGTINELDWLSDIDEDCIKHGLRFPERILYAFHTSLKTAEWSPLTVLAGVSGTGKSELPRLYSHFGGLSFLSLAVQSNWDSQESMLGFFNSIDNKFDAQPVLRLLAQSQKPSTNGYPGLQDSLCLILLDEMNLAHTELYFSDFLSKLEQRRGLKRDHVPTLGVKLGTGLIHHLPLGRNVLWAGTMNQDETTKSLSDKVLDRSIVIHFPRPTILERRKELTPLPEATPLLPRKIWKGWWSRESKFTDKQVHHFKKIIEDMNEALSIVGRALGHRIWQSIEYYMANYPKVRAAQDEGDERDLLKFMRVAFEDQLVQKVMPKLRGIETRGRSREKCLDKIRDQLDKENFAIIGDFDLACEFGYGQFDWRTANYLIEPKPGSVTSPETTETPSQKVSETTPAESFKPGEPNREEE